jgi:benzil reductase ((S)-benzoin forming)
MFDNSQVIISGSSRGLGKAIAEAFLEVGAKVIGISRSNTIEHDAYAHIHCDLSDLDALRDLELPLEGGKQKYILINNAGRLGEVTHFDQIEEADLIQTAHLNYLAPIVLINKFYKATSNESAISYVINIGSGAAYQPIDGWSMYCSTKAGLSMFTRVVKLEAEFDNRNFLLVDLSPGIIDTEMQDQIRQAKQAEFSAVERFKAYHLNGELQSSRQTADLIISNFASLFESSDGMDSLRNYK